MKKNGRKFFTEEQTKEVENRLINDTDLKFFSNRLLAIPPKNDSIVG
jgi:hypothetical protein